jgi:hypothetical protein
MMEEVLKSGGGNQFAIRAEEERLGRLEAEMRDKAHAMASAMDADSSEMEPLRRELQEVRARIASLKKESTQIQHEEPQVQTRNLADYKGQLETSGAYARLYYTRLIFWAILAIMLVILLFHAANATSTGLLVNTAGIIVCLIAGYYILRFVYNRVF